MAIRSAEDFAPRTFAGRVDWRISIATLPFRIFSFTSGIHAIFSRDVAGSTIITLVELGIGFIFPLCNTADGGTKICT